MKWFRRTPKPPQPDWVKTGNERWVVLKRADNIVREQLEREWIDLDTGTREWQRVVHQEFVGHPSIGVCDFITYPETRIRTLNEQPTKEPS